MQIIGLTGGIATGKSTACEYLQNAGIPVIDADRLSRDALQPGTAAYRTVSSLFPEAIDGATGRLDRAKLGERIFGDARARMRLEAVVHPVVNWAIAKRLLWHWLLGCERVVVDVPLLFEARLDRWVSLTVVVAAAPPLQIERLQRRNNFEPGQAEARLGAQIPIEQKCRMADVVIRNEGDLEALHGELREKVLNRPRSTALHRWLYHRAVLAAGLAAALTAAILLFL